MKSTTAALPDGVIQLKTLMRERCLTETGVNEGKVVFAQFTHHCRRMLDKPDLSSALRGIRNSLGIVDQGVGPPQSQLPVNFLQGRPPLTATHEPPRALTPCTR